MSKPAVSRYVAELEARLGVRLLQRTARTLSMTEEGDVFYGRCKEVLAQVDEAEAEITARSDKASGLLKLSVPVTFGLLHLAPLWAGFLEQNPKAASDLITVLALRLRLNTEQLAELITEEEVLR